MRFSFCLAIMLSLCCAAGSAGAQPVVGGGRTGDMFYDKHWVYTRPAVPSDMYRGQDMLPHVPLMYRQDADVFDGANKANTMGNEDMFPHLWVNQVPDHVLVIDE